MDGKPIQIHRLIEAFGFLGVIASLAFVAFEIRQNTSAVRGATIQGMAEHSYDFSLALAQSPDIRAAYLSMNDDDLDDDEQVILAAFFTGLTRVLENRFVQAKLGLVEYEDLTRFGAKSSTWRQPFFRVFWESTKDQYSVDFQEYVEREILSQPPSALLLNPESIEK